MGEARKQRAFEGRNFELKGAIEQSNFEAKGAIGAWFSPFSLYL
jgi:hypothetical protein